MPEGIDPTQESQISGLISSVVEWLKKAEVAYHDELFEAVVLYCVFAIDTFWWRIEWGKKFEGMNYIDLSYFYSGKKRAQEWKDWNKHFKAATGRELEEVLKQDLYAVAKKHHWLTPEEYGVVQSIVAIRNVFSHFNPWEISLQKYHTALQRLELKLDSSRETVSRSILQTTINLLNQWFPRLLDTDFRHEARL